jgi:leucyl aminopeptidase
MKYLFLILTLFSLELRAHEFENLTTQSVLASIEDLKQIKAPLLASDPLSGVGYSRLTPELQMQMQAQSHRKGKCGGFEVLTANEISTLADAQNELHKLRKLHLKNESYLRGPLRIESVQNKAFIEEAVSLVQTDRLQDTVTWLSSFKTRNEKSTDRNAHVLQMKTKAEGYLKNWKGPWKVELVDHTSTRQKSLKVTLTGKSKPQEMIVLGGHHDSTASSWGGANNWAPGADDNASGSSNLFEILRILAELPPSERTVKLMWYAAEESGLLGSAEIAKQYKAQKQDVIAVLQLDMTAYPGAGDMTISNVTDFTSPWLHDLLKQLNQIYVGLNIVDDKCGYACSDHASWYRQGFSTVVPFESTTRTMNPNIHTREDVVSPKLNFKHSAAITQLSLSFALELANTDRRAP